MPSFYKNVDQLYSILCISRPPVVVCTMFSCTIWHWPCSSGSTNSLNPHTTRHGSKVSQQVTEASSSWEAWSEWATCLPSCGHNGLTTGNQLHRYNHAPVDLNNVTCYESRHKIKECLGIEITLILMCIYLTCINVVFENTF